MKELETLWNLADKEKLAEKTLDVVVTTDILDLVNMLPSKEDETK
jgi:hypothetical protein